MEAKDVIAALQWDKGHNMWCDHYDTLAEAVRELAKAWVDEVTECLLTEDEYKHAWSMALAIVKEMGDGSDT